MRRQLPRIAIGAGVGAIAGASIAFLNNGDLRRIPLPTLVELQAVIPSMLLWIGFSLYWTYASANAAARASGETQGSTLFHQVIFNLAMLLSVVPPIPGVTWRVLPHCEIAVAAGATLQLASILLAVWARSHLGSNWSAEVRIAENHRLVQSGPYQRLRHPIYTAVLGMFLGTAIATGEAHSLVALAVMAAAYWRKIRLEEQLLEQAFGAEFTSWKARTGAILPHLWHA